MLNFRRPNGLPRTGGHRTGTRIALATTARRWTSSAAELAVADRCRYTRGVTTDELLTEASTFQSLHEAMQWG
jgi:hypothetical protein